MKLTEKELSLAYNALEFLIDQVTDGMKDLEAVENFKDEIVLIDKLYERWK